MSVRLVVNHTMFFKYGTGLARCITHFSKIAHSTAKNETRNHISAALTMTLKLLVLVRCHDFNHKFYCDKPVLTNRFIAVLNFSNTLVRKKKAAVVD